MFVQKSLFSEGKQPGGTRLQEADDEGGALMLQGAAQRLLQQVKGVAQLVCPGQGTLGQGLPGPIVHGAPVQIHYDNFFQRTRAQRWHEQVGCVQAHQEWHRRCQVVLQASNSS